MKRRTLIVAGFTLLAGMVGVSSAAEPQVFFVVRHAERAAAPPAATGTSMIVPANDPPLSEAGRERAAKLAAMLRSAEIKVVFVTEFQRTRLTAEPTAKAFGLEPIVTPGNDVDALMTKVHQAKGNLLIVGHSNTVPDILKRLGIKDTITIADSEYDNLFIVFRPDAGDPTLIRLRF